MAASPITLALTTAVRSVLRGMPQGFWAFSSGPRAPAHLPEPRWLSRADIHLVELLYYVEELDPSLLANFPLLKVSAPTALEARHTPTRHLLSGPWDWGARVPIPVQASLPPVSSVHSKALVWSVERICQAKDIRGGLCPTENTLPFTRRETQGWLSLRPSSTSASVLISSSLPSVPRVSFFP